MKSRIQISVFCVLLLMPLFSLSQKSRKLNDEIFEKGDTLRVPTILFDLCCRCPNGYRIENKDSIEVIADFLKKHTDLIIEIQVHTDQRGDPKSNLNLSFQRANYIRNELINENKIDSSKVIPKGYGAKKPIYSREVIRSKKTKEEQENLHQVNRRVEFIILESKS